MAPNSAVLWTGGKDSALALLRAKQNGHHIIKLITFVPPNPTFLAHPLQVVQQQAMALNIPHELIEINAPFDEGYEQAINSIKNTGIDTLVTGDIAEVDNALNWIRERSKPSNMNVFTPLWYNKREDILNELLLNNFEVVISCIKTSKLTTEWQGKAISHSTVKELKSINKQNGLDICGENGEFHTLVTDCSLFSKKIKIPNWNIGKKGELAYLDFTQNIS